MTVSKFSAESVQTYFRTSKFLIFDKFDPLDQLSILIRIKGTINLKDIYSLWELFYLTL